MRQRRHIPQTRIAMDTPATEVLIPLIVFSCIFGTIYVIVTARHRQRMAMIEKGADPKLFATHTSIPLALGMLMLGIGIGIALGWVADHFINGPESGVEPGPYFVACLVCGGSALMLYHRMMEKKRKE